VRFRLREEGKEKEDRKREGGGTRNHG